MSENLEDKIAKFERNIEGLKLEENEALLKNPLEQVKIYLKFNEEYNNLRNCYNKDSRNYRNYDELAQLNLAIARRIHSDNYELIQKIKGNI